jgi:hypothetical protein
MGGKPANGIISYVSLNKKKREQPSAPAILRAGGYNLWGLALECSQALHQAALPPGSVVLVDGAFFSSLIQRADGQPGCFGCVFGIVSIDSQAGFFDECARSTGKNAIALSTLLVLLIALDLRLNICQLTPPKDPAYDCTACYFTRDGVICPEISPELRNTGLIFINRGCMAAGFESGECYICAPPRRAAR